MITATDSVSSTYTEALNVTNVIFKTSKKQSTCFAGELTLGENLRISYKIFTKVSKDDYLKLLVHVCVHVHHMYKCMFRMYELYMFMWYF